MKLGCKIRKLREMRQMKQVYIANKLNLSVNSYGKIERDEVEISFSRLEEIATVLNIKITTLINFDDESIWDFFDKKENAEMYTLVIKNMQNTITALQLDKQRLISIIERTLPLIICLFYKY